MNGPRQRIIPNHQQPSSPKSPNENLSQFSKLFSSDEGYRILNTVSSEEYKLLQDTKKILEEKVNLDKQYAENLQQLTAKADRIAWPTEPHLIASTGRELLMQWSRQATTIDSNADKFRNLALDDLIKNLLEYKSDSKKFLADQKRQYDLEHRKAEIDVAEAEKHYSDEAKSFVTRNNELTKAVASAGMNDGNRINNIKRSVIEKRNNVYQAHNEYVLAVRQYNFIDEQYVRKVRNLLAYHEEINLIINRQWLSLLEAIMNYDRHNSLTNNESCSIDPSHCYDNICQIHSNIPLLTTKPIVFNNLLLQISGLTNLKENQIIVDDTTINDSTINSLDKKIQMLTESVNRNNNESSTILQLINQFRPKETTYYGRKSLFEQEQQAENLQMKMAWEETLKNDLDDVLEDCGFIRDNSPYQGAQASLSDKLEDQMYFHGIMPRAQSVTLFTERGDYLVRKNHEGKIVLSIFWIDPTDTNKLKDGHFFIYEKNNMYYFQENSVMKPTVSKLITYYTRQKLELRNDGTRLIRPIERPDYIINDSDIILSNSSLGSGHFGEVTRGEYCGTPVAVKLLRSVNGPLRPEDRQNFINEALLLKRFKHKRIVQFIGIAAYREPLMIVMELVEQGSLSNYLKANELRVSQLTQMCYEIAKGMAYLESCNVIHRDLAARNCLVDKNGRIKVADFGLSRCLQEDDVYFTQIKEFPLRWWAVEVLSKGPYTIKSDVWSYGITIWEIFSKAALPYAHYQHNHFVIDAVKRGERLKRPEKCPANIYAIMSNCWLLTPKDRASFKEIVEILRKEKSILPKFPFFNSLR
ncbi:unnamed protein product [Adineta steineri]|uniref:Tyrosine-protein kinase n=2 Tax=Adineta steineri TaxID=433720 RepID=A0A818NV73_9BILA|nr:unnamed protein product [Adineta steineri]CAF3613282.1 unnamed protein product [Adineta steineri]